MERKEHHKDKLEETSLEHLFRQELGQQQEQHFNALPNVFSST
jgi:hypothetical protein